MALITSGFRLGLVMVNQRAIERAMRLPPTHKLIKDNQRTLLCKRGKTPCLTRIRIKVIEPGLFNRTCPKCGKVSWFTLVEVSGRSKDGLPLLRFHWVTTEEAHSMERASADECIDLGIARSHRFY